MKTQPFLRRLCLPVLIAGLLTGCVIPPDTTSATPVTGTAQSQPESAATTQDIPVVRYGRYRLVELQANAGQRDLLAQVVDITVPQSAGQQAVTVADAMRYVLLNSGYRLCDDQSVHPFNALPLPLAHYRLGPVTLKEALAVLAGPGWQMQVEQPRRVICFVSEETKPINKENAS